MRQKVTKICDIPAILWGSASSKVYLYLHGKGGNKEEAALFSSVVCPLGWQVLSIDLPEHGERRRESNSFDPWHCVKELSLVLAYVKSQWKQVALYANSIGAWFSLLSFAKEQFENCLFVSPILDMKALIETMMRWANVSEERLEKEKRIPTQFGETLSWDYWTYVLRHPITAWPSSTKILYAGRDHLVSRDIVEQFVRRFHCDLCVMETGEHWFHTEEQLDFLRQWLLDNL